MTRSTGGSPTFRRRCRSVTLSTTCSSPTIRSATLPSCRTNAQFPGSFTGGNLGNAIGGPWTKTYAYDDFAYSYPAPGSARPHAPTAIGPFTISNDANGNQTRTLGTGTSDQSQYLYDEENRLSCANKGPQTPSPSCNAQGQTEFIYDHAGVRKIKIAASPTIYPNQYYTDFGGGAGNQFKHIFIGSERILTKKARVAPDRQHWYYHPDHLGSTAMVTNENGQLVDALHYFPFGEVWLEERPASLPADYFFTAKEFDPETGFYDFGARYLDPRFSKWMTADPALGDYLSNRGVGGIYAPQNSSLYAYGWNNPATLRDPNGRDIVCGGLCIAGLVILGSALLGGSWHVGSNYYVDRSLENVTVGGTLAASGQGALWGGVAVVAPPVAAVGGLVVVGNSAIGLTQSAPSYFKGEMSVKEERQWEVGAAGVGLGLLGARSGLRGGCSFAEATPVTTSDGLKPIGELKIGDRVLARDEKTGAYAFEPITQVFRHRDPVEAHLTLEDPATGATEVIETTPNHPFHVPGRGFVEAAALKAGDPVSRALSDEPISTSGVAQLIADRSDLSDVLRVKTLTFENQPFWAYNLEVSKDHTFFVGATRAWVHNGPCPVELTPALMEQLAASRANLVTPRTATGVVAASPGQRGHSGQTNREGFPPSSDLMPQVLELAKQMGIPLKRSGASDNGVPGAFLAAHAEKQLALVADVFAVDTAMCAGCRQFVSNLSVAQGRTIIVQDPTRFGSSRRRAQSGSRFNGSTES